MRLRRNYNLLKLLDMSNDAASPWETCKGEWGETANRYRVSFWSNEKILKLDCNEVFSGYTKKHHTTL